MRQLIGIFLVLLMAAPALAVNPDEVLDDPVLEARAREISKEVRCLVCQNQSIDDSNAGLARDLRVIVRERLIAGDTDQQVLDFLVARYGDFVLLRPPLKAQTYLLWFGPILLLVVGMWMVFRILRRNSAASSLNTVPLSPDETRRLEELANSDG